MGHDGINPSAQEIIEDDIERLFLRLQSIKTSDSFTSTAVRVGCSGERTGSADAILKIDTEIETYSLILQSIHDRMSACRSRRNRHTSINALPQDVMLLIFQELLDGWSQYTEYYEKLFHLRSICKAWDAFIQDYFPFWLPTFGNHPPSLHDYTLPRSQNHPLHVRWRKFSGGRGRGRGRGGFSSRRDTGNHDRLMSRLMAERWPIGSFDYDQYDLPEGSPALSLLSSPAPSLETLTLSSHTTIDRLLGGEAPSLQVVTLAGVELGTNTSALAGLRSLTLERTRGLTVEGLLDILSRSPGLQALTLRSPELGQAPPPWRSSSSSPPFPPVSLSQLHNLEFNNLTSILSAFILSRISFAVTSKLKIAGSDSHSFSQLVEVVLGHSPTSKGIRCEYGRERIHLETDQWVISNVVGNTPSLHQSETPEVWREFFAEMIPVDASSLITSFNIPYVRHADPLLITLATAFPNLHTLSLQLPGYQPSVSLSPNSLCARDGTSTGTPSWRFPNLRKLTLGMGPLRLDILQAVAEAVRRRSDAALSGFVRTPLQSLTLRYWGDVPTEAEATIEEIRQVVDTVQVEELSMSDLEDLMSFEDADEAAGGGWE